VALIGANGHGRWHRRRLVAEHAAGRLRLVALVDVHPIEPVPGAAVPADTAVYTDHRAMLRSARPDVAIICTPPHTHAPIALDALEAGCDVLLEKPPVLSLAEHRTLADAAARTGRAIQVGFQALGSAALRELIAAIGEGRLGTITGIAAVGAWQRDDGYYRRAPWAGRRSIDGRTVLDGALANPFAHALMQCLAVAAAAEAGAAEVVELERYRARDIEVDDTTCLRVMFGSGLLVLAAVTLCGEDFIVGDVIVHGSAGRAVLEYPTDRLLLPGDAAPRHVPGRVDLLENLLNHRAAGAALISPLARTAPFTAVLEALQSGPPATPIPPDRLVWTGAPPARNVTIIGVNAALRQAADRLALLSELSVPWAVPPHRVALVARR
jgi:predicted dehydrogenase